MNDPLRETYERLEIRLDHVVLAAASLEDGARWLEARLGAAPAAGGQHLGWGTHNRVMQLGGQTYLELIAPDPAQPAPSRPRPFALDAAGRLAALAERPRLAHFLLRTRDIVEAARVWGIDAARIVPMTRGTLRWRIALVDDYVDGVCIRPSLIQWDVPAHPAVSLPDVGVTLAALGIRGPEAALAPLRGLADARVTLVPGPVPALAAELVGPRGRVALD